MSNPSPNQPNHRPLGRIALAVIGLVLVAVGGRQLVSYLRPDPITAVGTGTLTVDGDVYAFTPTTCFISEQDFVAAGIGYRESEQFWVSASSASLDLTVGTKNEIDQPAHDQLWLASDQPVDWRASGQTIVANAEMSDHRTPGGATVTGRLELRCDI